MRYIYEPIKKYLSVWKINENGSLVYRPGGWDWGDWGENIDFVLIQHGWYLLTTQTMAKIADLIGKPEEAARFREIAGKMTSYLNSPECWNGSEYRHKNYQKLTDDRANALMVISGVADSSKFEKISKVFRQQYHSSPWMEKFVLESLIQMGRQDESLARMKKRFQGMAESKYSTLWEIWNYDTTPGAEHGNSGYNHGWGGCPLILLSEYYAGIAPVEGEPNAYKIEPNLCGLKWIRTVFPVLHGRYELAVTETQSAFSIDLKIPDDYQARIVIPMYSKSSVIECNGTQIYKNETPGELPSGLEYVSSNKNELVLRASSGNFEIITTK
jgi:rubrerythrin